MDMNITQIAIYGIVVILGLIFFVMIIPSTKTKKGKQAGKPTPKDIDSRSFCFILKGRKGTYRFYNPFSNFLCYGGANSGKTKTIGKPLLGEYIRWQFAGIVYDYKDFDLTRTAYHFCKKYDYPYKLYYMNFTDMNRTHRTNIINPKVIKDETLFLQFITDWYDGLMTDGKKDEWYTGALGALKGTAIRFYKEYSEICTIPHIAYFICTAGRKNLTRFLQGTADSRILASAFIDAEDSERTQASYLSTLTNYLSTIANNRQIAYVLTGNDFDFNPIDPDNPKLICIVNSYGIESAISPIISSMISASSRFFTLENKIPFFYLLDEATTTAIKDFERMPSVLREYLVSFCMLTQSASKIEKLYGKQDRASIESNFGNQFYGRTKDILALETYQRLFGKEERQQVSRSKGATGGGMTSSTTISQRKEEKYDLSFFTDLKSGEFAGSASNANIKSFHDQFFMYKEEEEVLPIVQQVLPYDIDSNFDNIRNSLDKIIY